MIRNYFLVALRNVKRHRFFSFLTIFGLAISMSVCLVIIMLVADQMSFDEHNRYKERTYRVTSQPTRLDGREGEFSLTSTAPAPLRDALNQEITGVELSARLVRGFGNGWLKLEHQDANIPLAGYYADPEILTVMDYELAYGDPATALKEPHSVVLSSAAARKLFTQENPVGEMIKVGKFGEYKVTGVLKDKGRKTHISFEALASINSMDTESYNELATGWNNAWTTWVYFRLADGYAIEEVMTNLNQLAVQKYPEGSESVFRFESQAIHQITPGDLINNANGPFLPMVFIYFLGGLALIIMLTACFNYTNLSIARSLTRAKEVGVRKVSGAGGWSIFWQFITESVVISFLALILSLGILSLFSQFFFEFKIAKALQWDLRADLWVYGIFVLFSLVVGVLAGLLPAIAMSKFKPAQVLKSLHTMKVFSRMGLRKALLVGQFTLSLIFIISVGLVYKQLDLFISTDHGFNPKNKIQIALGDTKADQLVAQLEQYPEFTSVSRASHLPASGYTMGADLKSPLQDRSQNFAYYSVDRNYLDQMEVALLAGSNFTEGLSADQPSEVLVSAMGTEELGYEHPMDALGETLLWRDSIPVQVVGILKDFHHQMMVSEISPVFFIMNPETYANVQVSFSGDKEIALAKVEEAWRAVNPNLKGTFSVVEEELTGVYDLIFGDLVRVVGIVAFLAIAISCLGLLGMATYTTETRMKEISIRKVLGASGGQIVYTLSRGFLSLIGIAIVLGVPLAYMVNNLWLQKMAYRVDIGWGVVVMGVLSLAVLGLLTVGSQTLRAAWVNPVDKLKNE
ncbi:ABC transporter permease [Cytophagales bacterium LB-30]|uniref:ABC transporter permease n=1 Tax=Shiella aurantiaca TaxID=3058365 RepID=A0ABT8F440_9BACT|nr:ABC transporter permease [Shiella aurantiaca]MDN4165139.1 ABC transporter permease [Shiella aurantiaca]